MRPGRRSGRRRSPLWAKLCTILGAIVLVLAGAGVAVPQIIGNALEDGLVPLPIDESLIGDSIDGPINFLLVGIDPRTDEVSQRAGEADDGHVLSDSIIIAHVPATHDQVYMVSIPRDLLVRLPDYEPTGFEGYWDSINAAFAAGARATDGSGARDLSPAGQGRGAEVLIRTINTLVDGGIVFHGAAVINFQGFENVLEAIGGVNMCVEHGVHSIHYYPDGTPTYLSEDKGDDLTAGKYYPEGCYDMQPWEALDYARQRYGLPDSDYGRQRHQQQLIKAIIDKVGSVSTLTDLGKISRLKDAAGDLLSLELGNHSLQDWAFNLRAISGSDVTMIKTNGGQFYTVDINGDADLGQCQSERCYQALNADSVELLKAIQTDTVYDFLARHPDWISSDGRPSGS